LVVVNNALMRSGFNEKTVLSGSCCFLNMFQYINFKVEHQFVGDTKVALYGIGSMRDERLNRMWQGKKVRFLKPDENKNAGRRNDSEDESEEDPEDEDENSGWCNIYYSTFIKIEMQAKDPKIACTTV